MLSHHSAAALWELLKPIEGSIHVSIPTTSGRKPQRGIHLHRCPALRLTTYRHRIPVTTIQRTIDDLDGTVPPYLLRRAKRQAELKGIHLEGSEIRRARSDLEADFFALVHLHHLPSPQTNVKLGRWRSTSSGANCGSSSRSIRSSTIAARWPSTRTTHAI